MTFPAAVTALPPAARWTAAALRIFARGSLLWLGAAMLLNDNLQSNTLAQIRWVAVLFLVPEAAAWCVLQAFSARASIEEGALVLTQGRRRLVLPLKDIGALQVWRLPLPGPGTTVVLASGVRWPLGLMLARPTALASALVPVVATSMGLAGNNPSLNKAATRVNVLVQAWHMGSAGRARWWVQPWLKFVLFPLALAVPAFHLHQHIAYGGGLGEYYTFGFQAYLTTLALWWAAWAIGVLLCAAALRAVIEVATVVVVALRPAQALGARWWLERAGLLSLYLGLPAWLALRAFGG